MTRLLFSFFLISVSAFAEQPLCRVAVVCNLYLTEEPPEKLAANRRWITGIAPAGIQNAVDTVNRLQPDALLVMGSLTWTGSEADFKKAHAA